MKLIILISIFPVPYEDELLYSTIAKYHIRSGNTSYKSTIIDLFESDSKVAITDLPGNLMTFCKNTNFVYNPEYLIDNHTLYPYYSPFLPRERALQVKNLMINNDASSLHMLTGITASDIHFPKYLRYCTECYQDEINKYGEAYWINHRLDILTTMKNSQHI
jgi:hypothetical protein